MATRKKKSSPEAPKKPAGRTRSSDKLAAAAKPSPRKKSPTRPSAAVKPKRRDKLQPLDLSSFPPESTSTSEKRICLACVLDIFTRHLGLTPHAAHLEIKKYIPVPAELSAPDTARPWFVPSSDETHCPYCGSASKWHTALRIHRIEGGKATDASRRQLLKSLPGSGDHFAVLEEKVTQQHAFFEWLDKISIGLDLDSPVWLRDVSRHYLSRKEPKADWQAVFDQIHSIRRSRRESRWEIDNGRLFLAPLLFDELLLVQYLVSRSHRAGGQTLEGRYTLPELFVRLRNAGYLRSVGIPAENPNDALEQLVAYLGGGEAAVKFYYIVDRREFLEKVKSLKLVSPPRLKARTSSG